MVLTPRAPPSLCLGPPVPLPLPWRAPTSCSRAPGASVGAPHGAASPPPRRARPAQSARPARPQRSPARRGTGAGRQRGRGSAGARARPMVPGAPAARSRPCLVLCSFHRKGRRSGGWGVGDEQTFAGGRGRPPEAEQGQAKAHARRCKLPPRRPGGGEEKEGFGGNVGDLKSRPAVALHLLSSPRWAALYCLLLPPAGRSGRHSLGPRERRTRAPALSSHPPPRVLHGETKPQSGGTRCRLPRFGTSGLRHCESPNWEVGRRKGY